MTHYEAIEAQQTNTPQAEPIAYPAIRFRNGVTLRGWSAVMWRENNHGSFRPLSYWITVSSRMEHGAWLELCARDGKTYTLQKYSQYVELTAGIISLRIPSETVAELYASPELYLHSQLWIPDKALVSNVAVRRVWRSGWVCADTFLPVGYDFDSYLETCSEEAYTEETLAESLDSCYPDVEICGITFTASQILQELESGVWDDYVSEEREYWRNELLNEPYMEDELEEIMEGRYIFISEEDVERLNASQGVY